MVDAVLNSADIVAAGGGVVASANTWTGIQTLAVPISTTQVQGLQINGIYNGTNLFNRAIQDNSTFTSLTDGAYAGYDTTATMSGATAYNHMFGYEARQTYNGSGGLNLFQGFFCGQVVSGPVNALRGFAMADAGGVGTITEQSGFYVPNLTRGTSNYAFNSQINAGANNYAIYAAGTAKSLFNGPVTMAAGQTWSSGVINVTVTNGQVFNFATNTNLVIGGTGTIATLASLNDAGNTYGPMFLNSSTLVANISGTEKLRLTATQLTFGGQTTSFPGLKRNGAVLETRLGDDSGYAGNTALYHRTPGVTVSALTAAATAGAGARAFVTDATATTFLSTVAGGGANKVPVVCDGTNWLIG